MTDDGLGKKTTEKYQSKREGDQLKFECSDDVIDDIANNKKILISKGKNC